MEFLVFLYIDVVIKTATVKMLQHFRKMPHVLGFTLVTYLLFLQVSEIRLFKYLV